MTSRIRIFNRHGELLTLIEGVSTTPRSWVLNSYGRCEFAVPMDAPFATERFLQFGNLIHVEHIRRIGLDETGTTGKLPGWTGILLTPRPWSDGTIHIVAYSIEAQLAYRAMPFVDVRGAPLSVLQTIIQYTNRNNPPILYNQGIIDDNAVTFQDKLRTNAHDHIKKLAEFCGMDWWVEASIQPESFALRLAIYLQNKKTIPNSLVLNPENTKTPENTLTEQGTIFNRIYAYTQAPTPQDRAFAVIEFQESIDAFGPFEINKVYTGITDPAILEDAARLRTASGSGFPQKVFKRIALDVDRNFDFLRVGNVVEIEEPRAGFNGSGGFGFRCLVRILSMSFSDEKDEEVDMNVEILHNTIRGLNAPIDMRRT